jgi:hypothetical protein
MDDTTKGLYGKYRVERFDGKGIGRCIVLELDDPNTWPALKVWADTVEDRGFGPLAADVRKWIAVEESIARVDATIVGGEGVGLPRTITACGFCEQGIYRGRTCPYCNGAGRAPQGDGQEQTTSERTES